MINQLRVIWGAMLMSTIVYCAVVWLTMRDRPITRTLNDALRDPRTLVAYGVAIVIYFAAFLVSGSVERRHGRTDAEVRRAAIIRFALLELVCILGMVAAFLEGDWRLFLPTFVLAFIGFARSLPREEYRF